MWSQMEFRPRRVAVGWFALFVLAGLLWLTAAGVRLVLRDVSGWSLVNVLYYATPGPLLFLGALGIAGLALAVGHRRGAASWLLLASVLPHCAGSFPTHPIPEQHFPQQIFTQQASEIAAMDKQAGSLKSSRNTAAARQKSSGLTRLAPFVVAAESDIDSAEVRDSVLVEQPENARPVIALPADGEGKSRPKHRLFYWNVSHLDHGVQNLAAEIQRHEADYIVLLEAGPATEDVRHVWRQYFPDHDITLLGSEMMLLTRQRGVAGNIRAYSLGRSSHLREIAMQVGSEHFTLLVADIYGRPSFDREPPLTLLGEILSARRQTSPVVLVGDFNTPRESLLLQPVQSQMVNAFDVAGSGYAPTWPVPLPVLAIDQAWGRGIDFLACRPGWSLYSDHRPLIIDFQLAPSR